MAKKSKKSRRNRALSHKSTNHRLVRRPPQKIRLSIPTSRLLDIEDRRSLRFPISAPTFQLLSGVSRTQKKTPVYRSLNSFVKDTITPDALICVRRQTRREVLHALRLTGRGARSKKRRSASSNIHCK